MKASRVRRFRSRKGTTSVLCATEDRQSRALSFVLAVTQQFGLSTEATQQLVLVEDHFHDGVRRTVQPARVVVDSLRDPQLSIHLLSPSNLARPELHGDHDASADVGAAERSGMRPKRLANREIIELPRGVRLSRIVTPSPADLIQPDAFRRVFSLPLEASVAARSRHEGAEEGDR